MQIFHTWIPKVAKVIIEGWNVGHDAKFIRDFHTNQILWIQQGGNTKLFLCNPECLYVKINFYPLIYAYFVILNVKPLDQQLCDYKAYQVTASHGSMFRFDFNIRFF